MRWIGGFEGADHVNGHGRMLAMPRDSGHLDRLDRDYARLRRLGFSEVRESLGWRSADQGDHFEFATLHARMRAARKHGLRIRWTLMHYGVPAGMDLLDSDEDRFVERFAHFCRAVPHALGAWPDPAPRIYTPINELSFLCWAATCTGLLHPHAGAREHEGAALKRRLVRAALAGAVAIRTIEPGARMMWSEPLVHVCAASSEAAAMERARHRHHAQYEALDMLTGRSCPGLGGAPAYVDLIGLNYYASNQWELDSGRILAWHQADPRRRPLSRLLRQVHARYGLPLTLSETSHVGAGRGAWLAEVSRQAAIARESGIDLEGICLYPAGDRPDWQDPDHWHHSGLWDTDPARPEAPPTLARDYARAYLQARRQLDAPFLPPQGIPIMERLL